MDADMQAIMNMTEEELDAELRSYGYDPKQVGKTGARIAEGWLEAQRQRMRAEAAEARVKELEGEIERRNAAENRMFDGLEQMLNSDEPEEYFRA